MKFDARDYKMLMDEPETVTKVSVHQFLTRLAGHVGVATCEVCRAYDPKKVPADHNCIPVGEQEMQPLVISKEMASNTFQWEKGE